MSLLEHNTGQVPKVPANPRLIDEAMFELLKDSIKRSPEYLHVRPLIVYPFKGKYVVMSGNMRMEACAALGLDKVPCKVLPEDTTPRKMRAYITKENLAFGSDDPEGMKQFTKDCMESMESIFRHQPFNRLKDRFNFIAVEVPSEHSGVSIPKNNDWKSTAVGSHFDTFYSERYLTTSNIKKLYDILDGIPCESIVILANTDEYGGGGIYNSYTLTTAHHPSFKPVVVHEFGHSFAGLADEYFGKPVAYDDTFYNLEKEPWEPNITTLVEFEKKWKDLLPEGTPIPTPLNDETKDKIGVFEGGGYVDKGIYRPVDHCKMRDYVDYCPACSRAILQVIDHLSDK